MAPAWVEKMMTEENPGAVPPARRSLMPRGSMHENEECENARAKALASAKEGMMLSVLSLLQIYECLNCVFF